MSSGEEYRQSPALQGGDGEVRAAHAEREQRLAETEAQLAAGAHPGHDQQTTHAQGAPSAAQQQRTHGAAAPRVPDTGGRG